MNPNLRKVITLFEPVLVFLAGVMLFKLLERTFHLETVFNRWLPAGRLITIVLIAWAAEMILRKRGLKTWGLSTQSLSSSAAKNALFLLVTGGLVPLGITWFFPTLFGSTEINFADLVIPLLGQELFVVGYARLRFSDSFHSNIVEWLIVLLFLGAHANHTVSEPIGILFLAAMGWQGFVWARFMRLKDSLLPLVIAHFVLLVLYHFPGYGFVVLGLIAITKPYRDWVKSLLRISKDRT